MIVQCDKHTQCGNPKCPHSRPHIMSTECLNNDTTDPVCNEAECREIRISGRPVSDEDLEMLQEALDIKQAVYNELKPVLDLLNAWLERWFK